MNQRTTVASVLVDALASAGVRRIYGIAGDWLNGVTDAIGRRTDIRWIPATWQSAVAYRRKLLKPDATKLRGPLALMEKRSAAWRGKLPKNHAAGIACHESFDTGVACAVDVSLENERPRIHPRDRRG
jgi:hypothetical protein